ncbi:MAG: adenylate kinase [Parcubacteria group bacterium Gr01-1014_3]|nr:MAG: adenylate kinase [Parcubacteria group bacterium Gr01-1014_3]
MKKAVIIYGAPGAGKGTQANLLSAAKGLIHFDTGKFLELIVHDEDKQKNPEIKKEAKLFDTGKLLSPTWVLKIVKEKTGEIAKAGFSVVYSGSPRTLYEAFGSMYDPDSGEKTSPKSSTGGLIAFLENVYGKKNISVILLKVKSASSIQRNSNRKICSACGTVIMYNDTTHHHTTCPVCGGHLRKRTLDDPEVIKARLIEYEKRTAPIISEIKKRGYKVNEIDGEPAPYEVHKKVIKLLNR